MSTRRYSVVIGGALVLALVGCSQTDGGLSEPVVGAGESRGNAGTGDTGAAGDGELSAKDAENTNDEGKAHGDAPAFHFESGTLELGDFVYEEIKDDLFDPCAEISAEEFAAIGFEAYGESIKLNAGEGLGCPLRDGDLSYSTILATSSATKPLLKSRGSVLEDGASEVVPELFTYRGREEPGTACIAAVDTERGQFSVAVGPGFRDIDIDSLCKKAISVIEDLYLT